MKKYCFFFNFNKRWSFCVFFLISSLNSDFFHPTKLTIPARVDSHSTQTRFSKLTRIVSKIENFEKPAKNLPKIYIPGRNSDVDSLNLHSYLVMFMFWSSFNLFRVFFFCFRLNLEKIVWKSETWSVHSHLAVVNSATY